MNNPMILANVKEDFYLNFIKDDRYLWLLDGLKTTLIITVFAVIVGLIIGFLVAIIRSAHDKSGSFKILNAICRVYLTVIRGTPTMIQLLIMNFVIFGAVSINKIIVGGLAFGINSGAYVAEIVRSGIMSIDHGQTDAGRSLGLMFSQTMFFLTDYIDIEAIQALKESVRIMRGKKGKLFYLQLSFIGIYLLGAIACGIGLLWVIPYMQVTMANFYRKITGEI